ncbi:MAG TPA: hypothetical protein VGR02_13715 [Thermoanaerobaculia bacterium]|jgi:hypothetical protein|nr:hypothetical protein [Thermoanaerobaculia bacterium]
MTALLILLLLGEPERLVNADELEVTITSVDCASAPSKIFAVLRGDEEATVDLDRVGTECRWRGVIGAPEHVTIGQTTVSLRLRGARTGCRLAIEGRNPTNPNKSVAILRLPYPPPTAGDLQIAGWPFPGRVAYVRIVEPDLDRPQGTFACREKGLLQRQRTIRDVMFETETLEFSLMKPSLQGAISFALKESFDDDSATHKIPTETILRAIARKRGGSAEAGYRISPAAMQNDAKELGKFGMTLEPPK